MDTRETFFLGLHDLGVRARLASRGRGEERLGEGKTLGLIDLDLAPVQWANIRQVDFGGGALCEVDLGVPDLRLAKMPESASIAITTDLAAGEEDARWAGEDLGLGMIDALNSYPALNRELRFGRKPPPLHFGQRGGSSPLRIAAHPGQRCWTITLPVRLEVTVATLFAGRKTRVPTAEQLACYREIGRLLLNSPLSEYRQTEAVSA